MTSWHIFCDFDGTIAVDDVTDRLLSTFADPAWLDLEASWQRGEIGSRTCMAGQIALIAATTEMLDAEIAQVAIDPDFPAFVAEASRRGMPVTIVSDGLDRAIRSVLARFDLGHLPVACNRLERTEEGRWRLAFPFSDEACRSASGTCKCAVMAGRPTRQKALLVGDGTSDFCASRSADFTFAKGKLARFCREQGLDFQEIHGFRDALALLDRLDDPTFSTMVAASNAHPTETL